MRLQTAILGTIFLGASLVGGKEWFSAEARRLQLRTLDEALHAVLELPESEHDAGWGRILKAHVPQRLDGLMHYRDGRLIPLFVKMSKHKDASVRHRAMLVLARMRGEASLEAAQAALEDEDLYVRERAALTLRELVGTANPPHDAHIAIRAILESRGVAAERKPLITPKPSKLGLLRIPAPPADVAIGSSVGASVGRRPAPPRVTRGFSYPLLHQMEELDAPPHGYHGVAVYAIADGVVENFYYGNPNDGYTYGIRHQLNESLYVTAEYGGLDTRVFFTWNKAVQAGEPIGTVRAGYRAVPKLHLTLYLGPTSHRRELDTKSTIAQWMRWNAPLIEVGRKFTGDLRSVPGLITAGRYGRAYKSAVRVRDKAEPGSEIHADAVYAATLLFEVPRKALARARARMKDGWPAEALADAIAVARACKGIPSRAKLVKQLESWQLDDDFTKALKLARSLDAATKRSLQAKTGAEARAIIREVEPKIRGTILEPRLAMLLR